MTEPDVDPTDGRDETLDERSDRNWSELLQEVRATQTGTQILSGFLLTLAFQPRFDTLDAFQRSLYLVLVVTAALTTIAALSPVTLHRALFRRHVKATLVRIGHIALQCSLIGVALLVTGTVMLILDVVAGRTAGVIVGSALAVVIIAVAVIPRWQRTRLTTPPKQPSPR